MCNTCHSRALILVNAGICTWEDLEKLGLSKPIKTPEDLREARKKFMTPCMRY